MKSTTYSRNVWKLDSERMSMKQHYLKYKYKHENEYKNENDLWLWLLLQFNSFAHAGFISNKRLTLSNRCSSFRWDDCEDDDVCRLISDSYITNFTHQSMAYVIFFGLHFVAVFFHFLPLFSWSNFSTNNYFTYHFGSRIKAIVFVRV